MCRRLWTSSWTRPVTKSAARLPASLARSSKRKCRSPPPTAIHDFQCGILADEQDGIYREFPGCLNPVDSLEPGTFALPIEASDGSGRVAMSVMMVNSGDYAGKPEENDAQYPAYVVNPRGLDLADSDGYGTPSPEAIDWLGAVQSELGERNGDGKPVPAIAFQHIPPQEFYDCLR